MGALYIHYRPAPQGWPYFSYLMRKPLKGFLKSYIPQYNQGRTVCQAGWCSWGQDTNVSEISGQPKLSS